MRFSLRGQHTRFLILYSSTNGDTAIDAVAICVAQWLKNRSLPMMCEYFGSHGETAFRNNGCWIFNQSIENESALLVGEDEVTGGF